MTKRKKGALLISAFSLIAVLVVGGSLAYFTSQDTANNVFTLGKVSGDLTESTQSGTSDDGRVIKPGTPNRDGSITYDRVLPGDLLSKEPVVNLGSDSQDAYVRVKLEVINEDGKLTEEQKAMLITEKCLNFGSDWVATGDGYVYYQNMLSNQAGTVNKTTPVFTVVSIPGPEWGNNTAESKYSISITADLIQADNFKPETNADGKITGWGNVEIK